MILDNSKRMDRTLKLQNKFGFVCKCRACLDDPIYSKLEIKSLSLYRQIFNENYNLNLIQTVEQLHTQYFSLMELLKDNFANYPSFDLDMTHLYAFITLDHTSRPAHTFINDIAILQNRN